MKNGNLAPDKPFGTRLLLTVISLILSYFGYGFLTFPVLIIFGVLVFDYIVIFGPGLPILQHFLASLPGLSADADIHINGNDILLYYSLFTTGFWMLTRFSRWWHALLRQLFRGARPKAAPVAGYPPASVFSFFRQRLRHEFLIVTAVFLTAFIALPFAQLAKPGDLVPICFILLLFFFYRHRIPCRVCAFRWIFGTSAELGAIPIH